MYSQMKRENSQMLVEREKAKVQEGFEAAKSKVIAGMRAFEGSCEVLSKLSSDKNISFVDMRAELAEIKAQYESLRAEKADVESKFPSADVTELATKFEKVMEEFRKCKEMGLTYLQTDDVAARTTSSSVARRKVSF